MYNNQPTLYDLATTNRTDPLTGLIESVTTYAPEFSVIPVERRAGTWYKTVARTGLPTTNFRNVNSGVTPSKSSYKQVIKEMYFLDCPLFVDEAVVKGDDRSAGDVLTREGQGAIQSAIIKIGSQSWYGDPTVDNSNGFVGVRKQLAGITYTSGSNSAYASSTSTAYGLWLNPWGVHYSVGRDGEIALSQWQRFPQADPNNPGAYIASWFANLSCYIGLSVLDANSCWAVTGIDNTEGSVVNSITGLPVLTHGLTDVKVSQMIASIPANRRVGLVWFVSRLGLHTLQRSRSAVGFHPASAGSGTQAWSPPPTEVEGFPVVMTDSIINSENNS